MVDPRNLEAVDDDMAEVFRSMTGAQRLKIANDLFESARRMIASHLAAEHPDWDERRLQEETARRLLNGDLGISPYLDRSTLAHWAAWVKTSEGWEEILRLTG